MLEARYMPPKVCKMGGASRGIAVLLETAAGGQRYGDHHSRDGGPIAMAFLC